MTDLHADDLLAAYRAERGPSPHEQDQLWARLAADIADQEAVAPVVPIGSRRRVVVWAALGLAAAAALVVWWPTGTTVQAGDDGDAKHLAPHASERTDGDPRQAKTRTPETATGRMETRDASVAPDVDVPTPAPLSEDPRPGEPTQVRAADALPIDGATPRPPRRAKTPAPKTEPASTPTDSLAAETALIQRARAELSSGRAGVALQTLREYGKSFPKGRLAEEADAVGTMARCRMNPEDPSTLADAFDARRTDSLFSRQVRAACDAAAKKSTTP